LIDIESRSVQEERKKDQERKILSWFTLPQGLRPVLCKLAKIPTKKILKISLTQYNTCTPQANLAPRKQTLLLVVTYLLNPTAA